MTFSFIPSSSSHTVQSFLRPCSFPPPSLLLFTPYSPIPPSFSTPVPPFPVPYFFTSIFYFLSRLSPHLGFLKSDKSRKSPWVVKERKNFPSSIHSHPVFLLFLQTSFHVLDLDHDALWEKNDRFLCLLPSFPTWFGCLRVRRR